ncbi:MAG: restriction endonuclease subunit S [Lachnospiraceae bacterium]|nr:restriction endonuclease subunit S [Lachnospiraceae bacterium]
MVDICSKIGSGATPRGGKEVYCEDGVSFIRSQNVLDFEFSESGLVHINNVQAQKLKNVEVQAGDVLLNITGDSVARACIIEETFLPARVNQHVAIIRGERNRILSSYLLYFLQLRKKHLLQLASAGATRNALTKGMIEQLELDLPTVSIQRKIVSVLDLIMKKIALNREINDNLEQQAMALYGKFFPYAVTDELPIGWRVGTVGEIIEIHDSKRIPLSSTQRAKMEKRIYPYYGAASLMDYVDEYIFDGKYLLLGEDGTVVDNDGYPILQYVYGKFGVNNHAHILTGCLGHSVESLLLLFRHTSVKSIVTGAVQPKISQANLRSIQVVIPPHNEMDTFNKLICPLFDQIRQNQDQNKALMALRDTLLPGLMSGEIDISNIQL